MVRFALVLTLLAALGGAIVSSSAAAQETVTLTVWDKHTGPGDNRAAEQIYDAFMEKHPNIEIERQPMPLEQAQQTIRTALASGTGPDVFYYDVGPGNAGVFADAGLLMPLDDLAEEYGWNDKFLPIAIRESTIDGQLYGLGNELEFAGFYYNEALLREAGLEVPETFAELIQFCGEANEAGYTPLAYSQNPNWQSYHMFAGVVNNLLGPEAVANLLLQGEGRWDSREMIKAIETFFVDLTEAGCFIDDVNALGYDDANTLFFSGQALMHPTGTWLLGDMQEAMPDAEIGLMPFPAIEGGVGRFYPAGIGSAYFIAADTEHPEEAALLLDHIFSPESVETWVEVASFIPPVEFDPAAFEVSPLLGEIIAIAQGVGGGDAAGSDVLGYYVNHATPAEFLTTMRQGFQAVVAGSTTAEEQARALQRDWENWEGAPGA